MRIPAWLLCAFTVGALLAQNTSPAVSADPTPDKEHPPSATEMSIPSHGEKLYGIYYAAAGAGDHPTVVLLHGFPGYEQNLDLAQAIRRAGWNVLALHYRGSRGVGGDFSLEHAMEDADAMVAFARAQAAGGKYHIDRNRIVVIGHSMGGFLAAAATAHEPAVLGAVMIGTWDVTAPARPLVGLTREGMIARVEKGEDTEPADFLPLRGYSPHALASEIVDHRGEWDLAHFTPAIGDRPVLLMTANDGSDAGSARFAEALKTGGNRQVEKIHTETDHGFSGMRLYLESTILRWLAEHFH
jgi:pimeloyl-ACP methyl ester carboxylesterase